MSAVIISINHEMENLEPEVKKTRQKKEVYPFETAEDIKKVLDYFDERNYPLHKLAFVLGTNTGRRIGDILSLQWKHLLMNGKFRYEMLPIQEDKTDKLASPLITDPVKEAVSYYLEETGCDASPEEFVFKQLQGTHKGRVLSYEGFRKKLKEAVLAAEITYSVGTHSLRKTFGKFTMLLHPDDPLAIRWLQYIYNHADEKVTNHYVGLTREMANQYYTDFGKFFTENVLHGNGEYTFEKKKVATSFTNQALVDLLTQTIKMTKDNPSTSELDIINNMLGYAEKIAIR